MGSRWSLACGIAEDGSDDGKLPRHGRARQWRTPRCGGGGQARSLGRVARQLPGGLWEAGREADAWGSLDPMFEKSLQDAEMDCGEVDEAMCLPSGRFRPLPKVGGGVSCSAHGLGLCHCGVVPPVNCRPSEPMAPASCQLMPLRQVPYLSGFYASSVVMMAASPLLANVLNFLLIFHPFFLFLFLFLFRKFPRRPVFSRSNLQHMPTG